MDRMKKRTLCLLLAACMLLGLLAGCGKKNNAQQLSATVYVPQYLDLNLDLEYVRGGCCDGENLYVIGQIGHDATETDPDTGETYTSRTYTYDIFRISLADGASEKLSGYTGPGQHRASGNRQRRHPVGDGVSLLMGQPGPGKIP